MIIIRRWVVLWSSFKSLSLAVLESNCLLLFFHSFKSLHWTKFGLFVNVWAFILCLSSSFSGFSTIFDRPRTLIWWPRAFIYTVSYHCTPSCALPAFICIIAFSHLHLLSPRLASTKLRFQSSRVLVQVHRATSDLFVCVCECFDSSILKCSQWKIIKRMLWLSNYSFILFISLIKGWTILG